MRKLLLVLAIIFISLVASSQTYGETAYGSTKTTIIVSGNTLTVKVGTKTTTYNKSVTYTNRTTYRSYSGNKIEVRFPSNGDITVDGKTYKKRG